MDPAAVVALAEELDPALAQRLRFLLELDRLKTVHRRSRLVDGSRYENTAEHSWHLALFALVLAPLADEPVDLARVVAMLVCHDLVEVDAGDTYVYDATGMQDKAARERDAADRIFGLLPDAEATELRGLWEEYEARDTPEARFAYAVDRLQPILLNTASGGASWREHGIRTDQVLTVNAPVADGSTTLWHLVQRLVAAAADDGALLAPAAGRGGGR